MRCFPIDVEPDEKIVRAIGDQHLKNGRLKYQAFMPPSNNTNISVIRQLMGDDFCKDKAVSILKHRYRGLAVMITKDATALGLKVVDDRNDFYGHALIDYGSPPPPPNDPLYADERRVAIAL